MLRTARAVLAAWQMLPHHVMIRSERHCTQGTQHGVENSSLGLSRSLVRSVCLSVCLSLSLSLYIYIHQGYFGKDRKCPNNGFRTQRTGFIRSAPTQCLGYKAHRLAMHVVFSSLGFAEHNHMQKVGRVLKNFRASPQKVLFLGSGFCQNG